MFVLSDASLALAVPNRWQISGRIGHVNPIQVKSKANVKTMQGVRSKVVPTQTLPKFNAMRVDSKSSARKGVGVQVPPPVLFHSKDLGKFALSPFFLP